MTSAIVFASYCMKIVTSITTTTVGNMIIFVSVLCERKRRSVHWGSGDGGGGVYLLLCVHPKDSLSNQQRRWNVFDQNA